MELFHVWNCFAFGFWMLHFASDPEGGSLRHGPNKKFAVGGPFGTYSPPSTPSPVILRFCLFVGFSRRVLFPS
jgi:hypothetical protein